MKRFDSPILVTRPYLPPLESFSKGLETIWNNGWLTNNGPELLRFEKALAEWMRVPETNLSLFCNGTLALEMGFHALGLSGHEVITTPFTFVATSHALKRVGAIPVFADVDPNTLCLSPEAAEAKISPRTKAIVPVHVYGHPCDVVGFERLSRTYGVKIIYDAAHAFGVQIDGRSIATYGDMSMFSFHPTKLFHSCEGGMLAFADSGLQEVLHRLRNFAILGEVECVDVGTNAKMNELQALMGLECLQRVESLLVSRERIFMAYKRVFDAASAPVRLLSPSAPKSESGEALPFRPNYAYCPVLFPDFQTREAVYDFLKTMNVFARRYFYPVLTDFEPYRSSKGSCPIAESISERILTLPTYYGLPETDAESIAENILEFLR